MVYLNRQIKYRSSDGRAEINPDMEVSGWGMPRDERAGKINFLLRVKAKKALS
jgi:hypothetical protein